MVTDDMIQNHEKHFFTEAVLVNAIIDQIMNSGFWCKEHDKLMNIEKGISQRLESVKIYEESTMWRKMILNIKAQNSNPNLKKLQSLLCISMKIISQVQSRFCVAHVEFDFYGRDMTETFLDDLLQILLSKPNSYKEILEIVESLVLVQSQDIFTQTSLYRIIALATTQWMGTVMKPKDLRYNFNT